jgi:para-aminobenzoate synthetase component I
VCLDSNQYKSRRVNRVEWECLAAAEAKELLEKPAGQAFSALEEWVTQKQDWLFGCLCYDLKNEVEALSSTHFDGIGWPDMAFFQPVTVAGIRNGHLEIHTLLPDPDAVKAIIEATPCPDPPPVPTDAPFPARALTPRMPRPEYLATVEAIRAHIAGGDLYEMNLCQEFYVENAQLTPLTTHQRLNTIARTPFATWLRWGHRYLLSASPERFLKKEGQRLVTQPIKGTRPRGQTPDADFSLKQDLLNDEKDRSENVMIVDLVRNDFARQCLPGTIKVEELFGIYTFATVHQMISTVSGILPADTSPVAALRDCFPMGSMTGAPKVMAMELIERYEKTRRGLYSGACGYFTPAGDFDFNVVIRSILYNSRTQYASVQVGGAIVYDSVPEKEYDECLVKLRAVRNVLEGFCYF